jgi:DNA mismatch endonuclease (patch repair protein)
MPTGIYKHKLHTKEWKDMISLKEKGKGNPFYGRKHKKESKEKMRKWHKGRKLSEETKKKLCQIKKGNKNGFKKGMIPWNKNGHHTEETKEKIRQKRLLQKPMFRDTIIEKIIEKELSKSNIYFIKQAPLCGVTITDFYLPEYRIAIYCDGDYWHNRLEIMNKDKKINSILSYNGFGIIRLWEHEIKKDSNKCINNIKNIIKQHAKL